MPDTLWNWTPIGRRKYDSFTKWKYHYFISKDMKSSVPIGVQFQGVSHRIKHRDLPLAQKKTPRKMPDTLWSLDTYWAEQNMIALFKEI